VDLVDYPIAASPDSTRAHTDLLVPFFLITFVLTWGYSVLAMGSFFPPAAIMPLSLLGSFAPALVAIC
jgi:hypothetical protein